MFQSDEPSLTSEITAIIWNWGIAIAIVESAVPTVLFIIYRYFATGIQKCETKRAVVSPALTGIQPHAAALQHVWLFTTRLSTVSYKYILPAYLLICTSARILYLISLPAQRMAELTQFQLDNDHMSFVCHMCHRKVSTSYRLIHAVRCPNRPCNEERRIFRQWDNNNECETAAAVIGDTTANLQPATASAPPSQEASVPKLDGATAMESEPSSYWTCPRCSYHNYQLEDRRCAMCEDNEALLSSRDSPAMTLQPYQPSVNPLLWTCELCTYDNSRSSPACLMCGLFHQHHQEPFDQPYTSPATLSETPSDAPSVQDTTNNVTSTSMSTNEMILNITLPPDASAGQRLNVAAPDGRIFQIVIPNGCQGGETMNVVVEGNVAGGSTTYPVEQPSSHAAAGAAVAVSASRRAMLGAAAAAAIAGTVLVGPATGVCVAGAALYATTREGYIGDAARGVGSVFVDAVDAAKKSEMFAKLKTAGTQTLHRASTLNQGYQLTERASAAASAAAHRVEERVVQGATRASSGALSAAQAAAQAAAQKMIGRGGSGAK